MTAQPQPAMPANLILHRLAAGAFETSADIPPTGEYAERYWLPILGPTALLLGRRLHRLAWLEHTAEDARHGIELDLKQLGDRIGVGHRGGARSPLAHALGRLQHFRLLTTDWQSGLYAHEAWPELSRRQAERLPPDLVHELRGAPSPGDPLTPQP